VGLESQQVSRIFEERKRSVSGKALERGEAQGKGHEWLEAEPGALA